MSAAGGDGSSPGDRRLSFTGPAGRFTPPAPTQPAPKGRFLTRRLTVVDNVGSRGCDDDDDDDGDEGGGVVVPRDRGLTVDDDSRPASSASLSSGTG